MFLNGFLCVSIVSPKNKGNIKKFIFLPSHISKYSKYLVKKNCINMVNPKPKAKCPPFKIQDFQICHNNTYFFK